MAHYTARIIALSIAILLGYSGQHKVQAQSTETLTVAGGCFWCVEADFEKVNGVKEVISGFAGGEEANPSYKDVVRGRTGHVEAVQIIFNPSVVSRQQLLNLFVRSIDPTDAGGQFCDRGPAYRTAIFVDGATERAQAETVLADAGRILGASIVTQIKPETRFWAAGAEHQDYYKSQELILTRFGPRQKATAYTLYRTSCGRDKRVDALWGSEAPFTGPYLDRNS